MTDQWDEKAEIDTSEREAAYLKGLEDAKAISIDLNSADNIRDAIQSIIDEFKKEIK